MNHLLLFIHLLDIANLRLGHTYIKNENIPDRFMQISRLIRSIHRVFGVVSPFEDLYTSKFVMLKTFYISFLLFFFVPYWHV